MNIKIKRSVYGLILDNVLWLLWAFFYAFAYPTYNLSFTVWFIFIPVLAFAYLRPVYLTVAYSFFYGILFFSLTFFWIYGFWFPSLFLIIPLYAVYYAFFFMCIALIGKKLKKWRYLLVPMIWVSSELLRSAGFHGLIWNFLGDSQWKYSVLIQSADLFGVWGISFLILLANSVIADVFCALFEKGSVSKAFKKNAVKIGVFSGLFILNLIYGLIQYRSYQYLSHISPKEKLALIQPNSPSRDPDYWRDRWKNYGIMWKLNAEAAIQNPDMIVWSETMVKHYVWYYLNKLSPDEEVNILNLRYVRMPGEFNIPILFTSPDQVNEKNYNTADYLDPAANTRQRNAKIHLVPFGEWMPVYDKLPIVKDIMNIEGAGSYTPSTNYNVIQGRKSRFRVLICYEDLYAQLARKFIRKRVNYFINSTNDGWAYLEGFRHPMWQHLAGATLTAISVRRPIARAANTGVTGIIDVTGGFSGNIGDYQRGLYVGDVPLINDNIETIYVKFGFLFPYLLSLISFGAFSYVVFKKDKN